MYKYLATATIALFYLCCTNAVFAQNTGSVAQGAVTDASTEVVIETFTPPARIKVRPPKYPIAKQYAQQEGWVTVNYMIDTAGKPYDITVIDATDRQFEKAALRAVRGWRYEPATLDGNPIDAGEAMRITFALSGAHGATRKFIKSYRRLMAAIEADQQEEAKSEFESIRNSPRNLYEEAYYQLAQYQYAVKWNDDRLEQLRYLSRATQLDRGEGFLPKKLLTRLLVSKLHKELELNRLADALGTGNALAQRDIDDATRAEIKSVQEQIASIKSSAQSFGVRNNLDASNRSSHRLLKNTFAFTKVDGDIAELRLHCDKGYVGFTYKPEFVYTINPTWDACRLIMIGTPGTTYTLQEGA